MANLLVMVAMVPAGRYNDRVTAYLWIGLGSALGGMARHWITSFAAGRTTSSFPWATLVVNLLGSFLIGLIAALPSHAVSGGTRSFLTVGVLGGFTTFSAFSLQTVSLFQNDHPAMAITYVAASVLACPLCAWAGWSLIGRAF